MINTFSLQYTDLEIFVVAFMLMLSSFMILKEF